MKKERDEVVKRQIQSGEKIFVFKGKGRSYHVYRQKKISGKNEKREENESQERSSARTAILWNSN